MPPTFTPLGVRPSPLYGHLPSVSLARPLTVVLHHSILCLPLCEGPAGINDSSALSQCLQLNVDEGQPRSW